MLVAMTSSQASDLIQALAALLWALAGVAAIIAATRALKDRSLTELTVGPTGLSFKRAELKLQESVREAKRAGGATVSPDDQRKIIQRLNRNKDLLACARVLWVDDHPEYNVSVVQLLEGFGTEVDLARTNAEAFEALGAGTYDVIITDVGRDDEGEGSDLKGIELAEGARSFAPHGVIVFTLRFDPANHRHGRPPRDATSEERLALVRRVQDSVFGTATRVDELLHLVVDLLSR